MVVKKSKQPRDTAREPEAQPQGEIVRAVPPERWVAVRKAAGAGIAFESFVAALEPHALLYREECRADELEWSGEKLHEYSESLINTAEKLARLLHYLPQQLRVQTQLTGAFLKSTRETLGTLVGCLEARAPQHVRRSGRPKRAESPQRRFAASIVKLLREHATVRLRKDDATNRALLILPIFGVPETWANVEPETQAQRVRTTK